MDQAWLARDGGLRPPVLGRDAALPTMTASSGSRTRLRRYGLFARANRLITAVTAALLAFALLATGKLVYDSSRPAVSTLMVGRWITGRPVDRQWTPLGGFSSHLVDAVLMSEDGQFCTHGGVDWAQLHEVMANPDGPSRGASTITMQVARNLYLWNGRSFIRKGLEIPLALLLDGIWSKKRILEVYLNIAEWGDGVFGAEAAARHDFGKPASQLTLREAALMATALPNPFLRHPARPTRMHRELAAINLARIAGAGEWTTCVR